MAGEAVRTKAGGVSAARWCPKIRWKVRLNAWLGVMEGDLERRAAATTCVPQSQNLHHTCANAVEEVIRNSCEMQAPHTLSMRARSRPTDARFGAQKQKSLRKILIEGFWCKIAIFIPPFCGAIDLSLCALGDANVHGLSSHDDERVSQEPPRPKQFLRDPLRR